MHHKITWEKKFEKHYSFISETRLGPILCALAWELGKPDLVFLRINPLNWCHGDRIYDYLEIS